MKNREIRITEDGSTTLELIGLNEHFHSTHGAIQESMHIFIQNGLLQKAKEKRELRIFEMGFGTGLNALLTLIESSKNNLIIDYLTIEAYPVEIELIKQLNFPQQLYLEELEKHNFYKLHTSLWNQKTEISPNFHFEKQNLKLEEISLEAEAIDLVYFDAFNPDLQPDLWTEEVFSKIYFAMKPAGILMTYSAKGKVKRALKSAGFILNSLPGPIGKREITQAVKI